MAATKCNLRNAASLYIKIYVQENHIGFILCKREKPPAKYTFFRCVVCSL